mmetsp:Transcript_9017/g.10503  ORF Transcript_9017/g.10503 Transcript_9017/m.10503 type:complete len:272 (-) Transcript_9017:1574-2389(-)
MAGLRKMMLLKWICFFGLLFLSSFDSAYGKKPKRKTVKSIYSGASPAGATKWLSDSSGSIYTDVDLSHLNLDRTPRYICSVTASSKGSTLLNSAENIKLSGKVFSPEGLALMNVTGKSYPRKASARGFRLRLKYAAEDGRNLTASVARIGGWRVKWIAITNDHPIMKTLIGENEDVDLSYLTPASYIKMVESIIREEKEFTSGLLGRDYELPLSQQPKPKPKPKPKAEGGKTSESEDNNEKDKEAESDAEPETDAEAGTNTETEMPEEVEK